MSRFFSFPAPNPLLVATVASVFFILSIDPFFLTLRLPVPPSPYDQPTLSCSALPTLSTPFFSRVASTNAITRDCLQR